MAELKEREIKELDVDWYCLINGVPTHIASMGGMIPVGFRDTAMLRRQQDWVANIEPFAEVRLNESVIRQQVEKGYEYLQDEMIRASVEDANKNNPGFTFLNNQELPIRLFAATFVEKARRGFRSFARREEDEGNDYVLIAEPVEPVAYKAGEYRLVELQCKQEEEGTIISF